VSTAPLIAVPDVAEAFVADVSGELVARAVLSRFLAGTRSKRLSVVNVTCRALAMYGNTGIPRNGHLLPPPYLDIPAADCPTGPTALKRAGLTQAKLRGLFRGLEDSHGIFAAFDDDLLAAFFPPVLWPVILTMILDGPGVATERAERAVRRYAGTLVPATKRRGEGPPARGTVLHFRDSYHGVFRVLVQFSVAHFPFEPLADWVGTPTVRMPDVEMWPGLKNEGPRPELLRQKWDELTVDIARRLGISPGDDELAALEAMPESRILFSGLFYPLRARVVLGLMVLTAGRVDAIAELFVSDYEAKHIGPPPDYRTGPALLVRPGKHLPASVVRAKAIPLEFAAKIDVYIAFLRRAAGAARIRKPHLCPDRIPDDFPLLVSRPTTFQALGQAGIRNMLSGVLHKGRVQTRPLIVRESGMNENLTAQQREGVGYNPGAYRHTASQMAERAGEIWEKEHPTGGSQPKPTPAMYASALQDHKPPGDPLRALYGDKNVEAAYELLSGRAIEVMWRLLTTDDGARRRIDTDAYAETWRRCRDLERERAAVRARADAIYREPDAAGSTDQRLAYQTRAIKVLFEALDHAGRLGEALRREEGRLKDLRYDESLWLCIPDDAPPRTEYVDIAALEASLAAEPEGTVPTSLQLQIGLDRGSRALLSRRDCFPSVAKPSYQPGVDSAAKRAGARSAPTLPHCMA